MYLKCSEQITELSKLHYSDDLISSTCYCLLYKSYYFDSGNLVLNQQVIALLIVFFILITCLLDSVLILSGEILS